MVGESFCEGFFESAGFGAEEGTGLGVTCTGWQDSGDEGGGGRRGRDRRTVEHEDSKGWFGPKVGFGGWRHC